MDSSIPTVYLIDSDPAARLVIREAVNAINLPFREYASGREFFQLHTGSEVGCLVLEVQLPDMSGLQIQRRLAANRLSLPLVFVSAQPDVSLAVDLVRRGAANYLQKPLQMLTVLDAIQEAVARGQARRRSAHRKQHIAERIAMLTVKEREVLKMVARGEATTRMAQSLGVSRRAVEIRRANAMKKLRLRSLISLMRFALLADRKAGDYLSHQPAAEVKLTPPLLPGDLLSMAHAASH